MKYSKALPALALAAALSWRILCPAPAYGENETVFSDFRIDASDMAFIPQELSVQRYAQDDQGQLQKTELSQIDCTLNLVTGDASFYIQPKSGGVWVTVDYLTDLDGDEVYELIQDGSGDGDKLASTYSALEPASQAQFLSQWESYVLSAGTLSQRSQTAVQSRSLAGSSNRLPLSPAPDAEQRSLCLVELHRAFNGAEQTQSYYLKIFGSYLTPTDVPPDSEYFQAVEYVLSKGYLSGLGSGEFRPDEQISRSQLAQTLWRMSGSPATSGDVFTDVTPQHWFYDAVSWCSQQGIITGTSQNSFAPDAPVSQQQAAVILFHYAALSLPELDSASHALDRFPDAGEVAPWAQGGMNWAISNGLITGFEDGALHPNQAVTRGQLAQLLYLFDQKSGKA